MRVSRIVIKNLRALKTVDVAINSSSTIVVGENNTGKSTLIYALRLCLDVGLPSTLRALAKDDIHCEIDQSKPFQVLVGVEFADFEGHENEEALLHGTQIGENRSRIFYRFRPKRRVREALAGGGLAGEQISLDDYSWEIFGGGNPEVDLPDIEWNHENADFHATSVGLQYLQSYLVVYLPALRDVEADLQQTRRSSLARLVDSAGITKSEQDALVAAVSSANEHIEGSPTIKSIAGAIGASFKAITGPAFSLDIDLGLASPSFQSITRNLIVLLSSPLVRQIEPRRNGLGLNNILYIAILIEHFQKRASLGKSAGELVLIEEPEAHLHPQMQSTLLDALRSMPFQCILTTHSTHVSSRAPLSSFVMLTQQDNTTPVASVPTSHPTTITPADVQDLERYLDATKSNLLFARRVMLVEGAAELLLIPPMVKRVLGLDLEREGISIVAIHGIHFGPFSRLFSKGCLPKRCAIVADADLSPQDVPGADEDLPTKETLNELEGPYVKVFLGATTFEREITLTGNLGMLAMAAADLGAPKLKAALELQIIDDNLKDRVLRTAKRFGKARFAQVASRHVEGATALPKYIRQAIEWLRGDK